MACWYVAPEYCALTPLIASQQASFSGTRTALLSHFCMAATATESTWPSKIPQPCTQAYSVPEWFTPRRWITWPVASTSVAPDARTVGAGPVVTFGGVGVVGVVSGGGVVIPGPVLSPLHAALTTAIISDNGTANFRIVMRPAAGNRVGFDL